MFNQKKKQKELITAYKNDTEAVKDFLIRLKSNHFEQLNDDECQALDNIDHYFSNLSTFFAGFEKGLR